MQILLTSFQTWLPHQLSNSSNDLLNSLETQTRERGSLTFLRQLPVDVSLASQQAIAAINALQPQVVICCGMAESRKHLTVESNACWDTAQLHTTINLEKLVVNLSNTTISHDAGKFVCEGLYYQILSHLQQFHPGSHGLFVHIPILTQGNLSQVMEDFHLILSEIAHKAIAD